MSELIKKVVNEIAICRKSGGIKCEQVCDYCNDDAARAIKAVLEHYSDPRNISDRMADARLTELNIDDIRSNHRTAIAVAMAAALKQLGDSK